MTTAAVHEGHEARPRPREFCVNIEGREYPWFHHTIMVPQIRDLGGLPADQPVLEINLDNNTERTLGECEVVELKPGHAFCKKVKYKRG
jgi:hypothetical protein